MALTIDGWRRTGYTAVSRGPWIVAKVRSGDTWTYEVWHEQHALPLERCGSFDQAKRFVTELENQNGRV